MYIQLPDACRDVEDAVEPIDSRFELERLVTDLSMRFLSLSADQGHQAIRDALQRIGEALDLDSCAFHRMHPDGLPPDAVGWAAPGIPAATAPLPGPDLLCFSSVDDLASPHAREHYRSSGIRAAVIVPMSAAGRALGVVTFNMVRRERRWPSEDVDNLRVIATAIGNFLLRCEHEATIQAMLTEIERLRGVSEQGQLRRDAGEPGGAGLIVGQSPAIRRVLDQAAQVAATDSTVLLLGETGSGKELFATRIHGLSGRRTRTMVRVNCSAIPATLLESELYGREKGAYTGALARQIGRFELADHSTIFLDEIGDLPHEVQVKLLRVLEERQIERLGSPKAVRVDTRIIAATHRNLEQRIAEGAFREDLFYRLNVFPIHVPPLRERVEDIPLLVWRFVEEFSKTFGKPIDAIPHENMATLQRYTWPGNIRELRNVVERAMIVATGRVLSLTVPAGSTSAVKRSVRLVDVEKDHIQNVLESTGWRIRGTRGAADRLGLKPTTLETRLAKLGLKRPSPTH